jgi:hypothetical protein
MFHRAPPDLHHLTLRHNVDGVGHVFAKDFVHHLRGPLPPGFDGIHQAGIMINAAFPDVVVVSEEGLIAEGDKVVARSSAVASVLASRIAKAGRHRYSRR